MAKDDILILGATGRTGHVLVDKLRRRGLSIRAVVRDAVQARITLGPDIRLIEGNLLDTGHFGDALLGCDRVVFVAGSNGVEGRGTPREIEYQAVAALAAMLAPCAIKRFVFLSSAAVTQPEHPHNCTYKSVLKWKLRGEESVRRSAIPYTIVRALGLRDRPAGLAGVQIVQGDRIAFGEDIAREDLAAFLADVVVPAADAGFAPGFDIASLDRATFEVFNDSRLAGDHWLSSGGRLMPDTSDTQVGGAHGV